MNDWTCDAGFSSSLGSRMPWKQLVSVNEKKCFREFASKA